jgi:serine/threonine-protein kinase
VKLFESGVDGETYFYAMEYVSGETVTQRLEREKRIPWREAIEIGVQICKALKSAHNSGIIHRDLKPSNLMLGPDGTVKLTDFGVAQVFAGGQLTATGGVIGTAEYMSPEQAQGQRATKRSDIYSLGAVLYVMLTGRPPFTGKTALEIVQKHRFNQFDSPRRIVAEIPHWLDEVVCTCLEKKPDDRYPDAYVLMLRLQEVPKKVDLAKQADDFHLEGADATAETIATGAVGGPDVGGTLMRDLLRAHIEQTHAQSPVRSLLDNTWVLLALLALLIVGGVLWSQSRQVSPDNLFARGEELMARPAGDAWERARKECFEPLLELDAAAWEPRVAPFLDQIALYDLEQDVLGPGPRSRKADRAPQSEAERFLQRAMQQRRLGDFAGSEQTLEALIAVLGDDSDEARSRALAEKLLADVRGSRPPHTEQYALLSAALQRADALYAEGKKAEARTIWQAVLRLYDADAGAAAQVARARSRLVE